MAPPEVQAMIQGPLICILLAMVLYGFTCMQTFLYFQNYPNDHCSTKLTVAVMWSLETAHSIILIIYLNYYLIDHFSDVAALTGSTWHIGAIYIIGFLIAFLANMYFIRRIWLLSQNYWIVSIICILAIARLALGLLAAVETVIWVDKASRQAALQYTTAVATSAMVLAIATDWSIAIMISYYLHTGRLGLQTERTNRLVNRLLTFTVGTGALTSLFETTALITFFAYMSTNTFIGILIILSKLYANSLLMTLNARQYHARILIPQNDGMLFASSLRFCAPSTSLSESGLAQGENDPLGLMMHVKHEENSSDSIRILSDAW